MGQCERVDAEHNRTNGTHAEDVKTTGPTLESHDEPRDNPADSAPHPNPWEHVGITDLLCFMPTLGLGNSIVFSNVSDPNMFPRIRVWGTIGWIVAGLVVGFQGWSSSFHIFRMGAICAIVLGVYSFTLPHTPPPAKGKPLSIRTLFMMDAFKLLAAPPFLVFIICSTLICIPLAYYYGFTSNLLGQIGFEQPASTMTLGQMSEIFFMVLIPFFFRRLGVKWMILIGMAAWVARYLLFAFGAPAQVVPMILKASIINNVRMLSGLPLAGGGVWGSVNE